jgi:cyclic pyranopterin phosphate synthase
LNQSLVDRFGRIHSYLRISVTARCNFRCTYCMPADGIDLKDRAELLTYEEIIRLARIFVTLGVEKIRLTGGEPTIRKDLEVLIRGLRQIEGVRHLLMTTNGVTLAKKAACYREAGLTGLNISLDSLRPARFEKITGRPDHQKVMEGLDSALDTGFNTLKINVVLMAGVNEDEVLDFVRFVKDKPINVRFIEWMPFKGNGWQERQMVPYHHVKKLINEQYELLPIVSEASAVAKDFAIEGFAGTVSFITSMTENFCGSCNRIRLTAEGALKTCLFSEEETSLRQALRTGESDEKIAKRIREALWHKQKGHAAPDVLLKLRNRSMIQIGG